jgi:hypothetical protein
VLSTETVRSHLKRVYRKLDVHSRHDAVSEASRLRGVAVHATDARDRDTLLNLAATTCRLRP